MLCVVCASQAALSADVFRYLYTKGEKYHVVSTVSETVLVNGSLDNSTEELDKIAVEVADTKADAGYQVATFQSSFRLSGSGDTYELSEDYPSEFWRDGKGAYAINDKYFMPTERNIPLFPDGDVAVGQTWNSPGSVVQDLRQAFGVADAFHFPVTVSYTYLRNENRGGIDCAVISASYTIFYKVPSPPPGQGTYPARVMGTSQQTYWWDRTAGREVYAEEQFDLVFTLVNGNEVEYSGKATGELVEAQPMDRAKVTQDIQNEVNGIPDASVQSTPQGVTITLDNVNFPPNSDQLLPAEQEKLKRIAEILTQYPDRDLLITGHTANVAGYTEQEHQALSEQRARAVADMLLSLGARRADQMTVRGMGDTDPVADNSTEAGRAKNRRVEITILEN